MIDVTLVFQSDDSVLGSWCEKLNIALITFNT